MDWILVTLTQKSRVYQTTPLSMLRPTAPLMDEDLLRHRHHVLLCYLPRCDPALKHVQDSLIATHVGEVSVDLIQDEEKKSWMVD